MTTLLTIAPFLLIGIVIMNGFAAGVVAILYHWRGNANVSQRALFGSVVAGLASGTLLLGPFLSEGLIGAGGAGVGAFVIGFMFAAGLIVSLPGAFLMSRKIGDTRRVDTSTFD
ncbi:hypothetical protein [Aurantiacibacter aquimixticola]|uniref:Uncharacterized protein n=1 Tax=Aurantiacibacter aquimixticola TaxID=1958945 RepID=A0A419RSP5_9SPHN|nr:hypothetical protein [Aurantiacibacter aquimixticola]RJY08807.1 hypothetical protein D6201_05025 [Aurantiacibacter aquimixticola]